MRILVVDDEKLLVKGITFNLENDGYEVDGAYDGQQALELFQKNEYDLIILDLMLPIYDGLSLCRKIRETSEVPIIMLTAKGEISDKILGLEYGADDYMTKPFDILELKTRIKTILRRSTRTAKSENQVESVLHAKDLRVDLIKRTVEIRDKNPDLTAKEFDLFVMLMRNAGTVFSRDKLLENVWGYGYPGDIRTVDVHIRRIREKIERDDANPEYIMTKWGVGYYFSDPGKK
ncbi:MAG: response regulator transcription factor [Clostridia bacterium]|nr:response regulator transcription factor [Clostridia bacterium]MBQ3091035.1 response regulator transcription factor [Clostridia bacterium]MBQ9925374.1 response regulator transcription factor [Clostridia bacterium]